jgi:hypothetical protein
VMTVIKRIRECHSGARVSANPESCFNTRQKWIPGPLASLTSRNDGPLA